MEYVLLLCTHTLYGCRYYMCLCIHIDINEMRCYKDERDMCKICVFAINQYYHFALSFNFFSNCNFYCNHEQMETCECSCACACACALVCVYTHMNQNQ